MKASSLVEVRQRRARSVEPGPDGPRGNTKDRRDLVVTQLLPCPQQEHIALRLWKLLHTAVAASR